jgi:hypothetical protein
MADRALLRRDRVVAQMCAICGPLEVQPMAIFLVPLAIHFASSVPVPGTSAESDGQLNEQSDPQNPPVPERYTTGLHS